MLPIPPQPDPIVPPTAPPQAAGKALVFGASGPVGRAVVERLLGAGWQVLAVSRQPREAGAGLTWLRGELDAPPVLPEAVDAIFSCGPLDAFARWYAGAGLQAPRVVAFGSTSAQAKRDSADAAERALVARLLLAERAVLDTAATRGAAATLLRPTLVYGAGRDASLTRIATLARRWGRFPLPRGATGLRQPVHVDDLAAAAVACLDRPASAGKVYALPGGERLAYREMVARVLGCLDPAPRLLELPPVLFRIAARLGSIMGRGRGLEAVLGRMHSDLVFDDAPARRDLGYTPRAFRPDAAMVTPPPAGGGSDPD
nr:NAD-dependent epimerase/dehydratase family protein [Lysobacter sp. GX 14042]